MDKLSIFLSVLATVALVLFLGPSILASNRGKILRNIAVWLFIVVLLGVYYQTVGPGRDSPSSHLNSFLHGKGAVTIDPAHVNKTF